MTVPRAILPGQTYLVTRRCTQRQFLLTPTEQTNAIASYCLGLATKHTGVLLNAVCIMSNHWHGVVSDPDARLPQFLARFHGLLAKAQNAALGRWENLWSSQKPSVVQLTSPEDVIAKMAYAIANPTSAGLVEAPELWPGVLACPIKNARIVAQKPAGFFANRSALPETISVRLTPPLMLSDWSESDFSKRLNAAVDELVQRARRDFAGRGRHFLGAEMVRKQCFTATPKTSAVHRALDPSVAARSPRKRVHALAKKDAFVRAYRHAWQRFRAGTRDAKFPAGTYALRLNAAVDCE